MGHCGYVRDNQLGKDGHVSVHSRPSLRRKLEPDGTDCLVLNMTAPLDCLVIGAGPAGLTAAIYLSRFHLTVEVVHGNDSRAALIPRTRNHAGFPGGIAGSDLLERMQAQASEFGTHFVKGIVEDLRREKDLFVARSSDNRWSARSVLLATGVVNNCPNMPKKLHDEALALGLLRYCPICDGYEVTDRRIAVIGTGERGVKEAVFLRMYSSDVSLISLEGAHDLTAEQRKTLENANIALHEGPCLAFGIRNQQLAVSIPEGDFAFDAVYPALGSVIRSELAVLLGAKTSPEGCIIVDPHQRTTIPGLYAAGDVAKGLDQISHAMGEAGVAATAMRNDLACTRPLLRLS